MNFFCPRNPQIGVYRQLLKAAGAPQHLSSCEVVDAPVLSYACHELREILKHKAGS